MTRGLCGINKGESTWSAACCRAPTTLLNFFKPQPREATPVKRVAPAAALPAAGAASKRKQNPALHEINGNSKMKSAVRASPRQGVKQEAGDCIVLLSDSTAAGSKAAAPEEGEGASESTSRPHAKAGSRAAAVQDGGGRGNAFATLMARSKGPDPADVARLAAMGYSEAQAMHALERSGYDLGKAADLLTG